MAPQFNQFSIVSRRYTFEAAHFLPHVPEGHKCKRMHGHNYEIVISVYGPVRENGFVIDFWDLDKIVDPIVAQIDHRCLNETAGLENPTAEIIGAWFKSRINAAWPKDLSPTHLTRVRVYETKDCWTDTN